MSRRPDESLDLGREDIEPRPGSYILLLRPRRPGFWVQVGRLGSLALKDGYYAYVGSALGPGGLRARVGHHRRGPRRLVWHIDHLRRHVRFQEVWFAYSDTRREHSWADTLLRMTGSSVPLSGFGASDCHCVSHLAFFRRRPKRASFEAALRDAGLCVPALLGLRRTRRSD